MQLHAYEVSKKAAGYILELKERIGTDSAGIAMCLGLQAEGKVELKAILDPD